jgi:peptidyl-prolyl cis-trans isomerase D
MAQKKFAEAAEIFTNTVYEQSDSLKPVADKLKLEIQTAQNVTRQASPNIRGALANTKFLGVLFSSDAIDKKRNTEAVEMGGNQLVAGRIVSYTPAQTQPLADVKDRAQAMLISRMSLDLARKEGAAKLAELNAANASEVLPAQISAPLVVSRDALQQQSPKLVDAVLRADSGKLPIWLGVDLGGEGYRVVRLTKLVEGSPVAAAQNRDQYLQVWSNAENTSYYEYLKDKLKVQIKVTKPDAKTDSKAKAA